MKEMSKYMKSSPDKTLPEQFSGAILEKNLAALAAVDESLFRRICLPVDGSHIHFMNDGNVLYERHQNLLPFIMDEKDIASALDDIDDMENIFLFGIEVGGQLDFLLGQSDKTVITVWDRDPWLIRLSLMKNDYSQHFSSGRLKLCMGIDILTMHDVVKYYSVICHPFLCQIYKNEWALLKNGAGEKRAVMCAGGLFVDDVAKALETIGFSLYTLEINKLALEEMEITLRHFDPQILFAVNYTNGLVELCYKNDVSLICWEVDPATDHLEFSGTPTDQAYIFTYRRANVQEFVQAGFRNVKYLSLASDTEKRSQIQLSSEERGIYGAELSFVGSSMVENAELLRNIFLSQYQVYRGGTEDAVEEGNRLLEEVLSLQRKDFSVYAIPDLLKDHFPDFVNYLLGLSGTYDPFMLVGEIAAAEKRINYLAGLAAFDLKVWGDEGWKMIEQYGIEYIGKAGHTHEINKIYCASCINIDINRIYQMDIIPMRIFDIMACGGFVLAEYSHDLKEIFEIGREVEAYRTLDELVSKTKYYLKNTSEALEIANRGREAVIKNHTIPIRVKHMLDSCSNIDLL